MSLELIKKGFLHRMSVLFNEPIVKFEGEKALCDFNIVMQELLAGNTNILKDRNILLYKPNDGWASTRPAGYQTEVKNNFFDFLNQKKTQELLIALYKMNSNHQLDYSVMEEFFDHKKSCAYNPDPKAYINRIFTLVLANHCTTIANEDILRKVAEKLSIPNIQNKTFYELQIEVRKIISTHLNNISTTMNLTTYDHAIIGWHIHLVIDE